MGKKEQFTFLLVVAIVGVALVVGNIIIGVRAKRSPAIDDTNTMETTEATVTSSDVMPKKIEPVKQVTTKPSTRVVSPQTKTPEPLPQPAHGSLFGTAWQFQKTVNANKSVFAPVKIKQFVLEFKTSANLSSNTDCNTLFATYTAQEGLMTIGTLKVATRMYCVGSEEDQYSSDLGKAVRYSFSKDGKTLTLTLSNGGVMLFSRITPTP